MDQHRSGVRRCGRLCGRRGCGRTVAAARRRRRDGWKPRAACNGTAEPSERPVTRAAGRHGTAPAATRACVRGRRHKRCRRVHAPSASSAAPRIPSPALLGVCRCVRRRHRRPRRWRARCGAALRADPRTTVCACACVRACADVRMCECAPANDPSTITHAQRGAAMAPGRRCGGAMHPAGRADVRAAHDRASARATAHGAAEIRPIVPHVRTRT